MVPDFASPLHPKPGEPVAQGETLRLISDLAAGRYEVLGLLGRDPTGLPAYLAREPGGSTLVVLKIQRNGGSGNPESSRLEVIGRLDSSVPRPAGSCLFCQAAVVSWDPSCGECHADIAGPAPRPDAGSSREQLLAAVKLAAQGAFEVLGEMPRAAGGGLVYFARDLVGGELVALDLQQEQGADAPGGYSLNVTQVRKAEAKTLAPSSTPREPTPGTTPPAHASPDQPPEIKVCPRCEEVFGPGLRFCPKDGSALRTKNRPADLVGRVIADRFHILRKLGEGGMGTVYLAEHVKMGRLEALKVMNPVLLHDPDALSRFIREAANASRINHPNVAAIYDSGETPDDIIYLAMEFVEGEPLAALLARERILPVSRAIEIARQVTEALSVAHELGIVHRDLKPDNIMLTRSRASRDVVKVVDFGIAKATEGAHQTVTRTGLMIGTPAFMSPEQLLGHALDGRSDLYSLGCILYEMVTGERAFAETTGEVSIHRRLTEPPPRAGSVNPSLPKALEAVIAKAMARSSEERHQTAGELREALMEVGQAPAIEEPRSPDRRPSSRATAVSAPEAATPIPGEPTTKRKEPHSDDTRREGILPRSARPSAWKLAAGASLLAALTVLAFFRLNGPPDDVERPVDPKEGPDAAHSFPAKPLPPQAFPLPLLNGPPNADIASPAGDVTIQQGQSVNFKGIASEPNGSVAAFSWTFPGGNPPTSNMKDPGTVTFRKAGTYQVTLDVTDDEGASDPTPATRVVSVKPPPSKQFRDPTPGGRPPQPPPGDFSEELERIEAMLHPDAVNDAPESPERALDLLQDLLPRLRSPRHNVEAAILQAEAHTLLGNEEQACRILEAALPRAATANQRTRIQLYAGQATCAFAS